LTFDDARISQVDVGLPIFKKHGARATFYTLPSNIRKRLSGWQQAVADGHEIGNHSVTHPCTGNYPDFRLNALENYTLEMMAKELDEANTQIEQLLGVRPRTFAYPCGLKFVGHGLNVHSYVPLVAQRFTAGRGYLDEAANDPTICDLAQALGTPFDGQEYGPMKQAVDVATADARWVIFVGHDIGPRSHQTTDTAALEALLEYLQDPETGVWLGTVDEIATYLKQRRDK